MAEPLSNDPERDAVPGLDPVAAARWRTRAPARSPWLHETVGERMAQRLEWIKARPAAWVSWSPLLAGQEAHRAVAQRYPDARIWLDGDGADLAAARWAPVSTGPWWRRWWRRDGSALAAGMPAVVGVAAADQAPPERVGLVWANMVLHAEPTPRDLLRRWHDWLAQDGFVMFSGLGPDTAHELRAVHRAHGWPEPAPAFVDMHDWGDLLVELGFAEPVMDMERLTLTYASAERLLADLRETGRNWRTDRFPSLRGRGWRKRWLQAVEQGLPRDAEGRLCLTVEVVYGHAFRPAPRLTVGQETAVPLDALRDQLRRHRTPHKGGG